MKLKEFRKKLEESTPQELQAMKKSSIEELFNLRFQLKAGKIEDPTKVTQLRKNVARIETILSEKKRSK